MNWKQLQEASLNCDLIYCNIIIILLFIIHHYSPLLLRNKYSKENGIYNLEQDQYENAKIAYL